MSNGTENNSSNSKNTKTKEAKVVDAPVAAKPEYQTPLVNVYDRPVTPAKAYAKITREEMRMRHETLSEFNAEIEYSVAEEKESGSNKAAIIEADDSVLKMIFKNAFDAEKSPQDFYGLYKGAVVCRIGMIDQITTKLEQSLVELLHGKGNAKNLSTV